LEELGLPLNPCGIGAKALVEPPMEILFGVGWELLTFPPNWQYAESPIEVPIIAVAKAIL
jgi:hypothetical protein